MFVTIDISQTTGFSLRCEVDWGYDHFQPYGVNGNLATAHWSR